MLRHTLVCSLWWLSIIASAQDLTIDTINVNARRINLSEHSAAPMQMIDRKQMERMGIEEVNEAVKHMSGVQVKDYGGIGGLKTVNIRSLGAQHTSVLYDGVPVSDVQTGQVDIGRYSLDNVENLSLTIGQSDDIYKPAKTYSSIGVLEINNNIECDHQQAEAQIQTGSYGLINPLALYRTRINNKVYFSTYANWLHADGGYHFTLKDHSKDIKGKRNNSDIESWRVEANLLVNMTEKQSIHVKAYLFQSERGLPGGVIYDNPYAAERLHDRNYFGQVKYENTFSPMLKMQINGKFNWAWNRYTNKTIAENTDETYRQTETYADAILLAKPIRNFSVSFSQDFTYNYLHTSISSCPFPSRQNWQTALALQYHNNNISATTALLNTYINEDVKISEAAADQKRLSPSFNISWKPFRDENLRVRMSYKDSFRAPTFNDLYYLLIGNRDLKPEITQQWNAGVLWSHAFDGTVKYVNATVDTYYGKVDNKIVAIPKMFFWSMYNVGKVETKGIDATLSIESKVNNGISIFLNATYNYMIAEDITDQASSLWRNQLPYVPKHSGSSSLSVMTPTINLAYNLVWNGSRYSLAQNSKDNKIKAYTDHSISLYKDFPIGKHTIKLKADILNIGNNNYEVVRFYPMQGRNYKFTITYIIH